MSAATAEEATTGTRTARRDPVLRLGRGRVVVSTRVRRRTLLTGVVVALLLMVTAAYSMTLGSFEVPLPDLVATVLGRGDGSYDVVVRTLRLPRLLAGMGAGAALALSGALLQSLVRNPLVAPDIVGITNGAALTAVVLIIVAGTPVLVPVGAGVGALATAGLLFLLAWRRGISGARLVLIGIGVQAIAQALTTLLLVRSSIEQVAPAVLWLTGTLHGRTWQHVGWVTIGVAVLLPLALVLAPRLRTLALGDDAATALGLHADRSRVVLLLVAAAAAAVAVAVAGPVPFVALVVPHVARLLLGPTTGGVLVVCALLGALLVVVSDALAQHAFPVGLPVGVVTALVGAPYFLFLLHRSNRGAA